MSVGVYYGSIKIVIFMNCNKQNIFFALVVFLFVGVVGSSVHAQQAPLPDLAVTAGNLSNGRLSFTIVNQGQEIVSASQGVTVVLEWLDDRGAGFGSLYRSSLFISGGFVAGETFSFVSGEANERVSEASASALAEFLAHRPGQTAKFRFSANPYSSFQETGRGNNILTVDVPLPDLVVESVTLRQGYLSYTLKNVGEGDIVGGVVDVSHQFVASNGNTVAYRHNGNSVYQPAIIRLANVILLPGASLVIASDDVLYQSVLNSLVSDPSVFGRAADLRIVADSGVGYRESEEGNNTALSPLASLPKADLVIEELSLDTTRLSYRIKNQGQGSTRSINEAGISYFTVAHQWLDAEGNQIPFHLSGVESVRIIAIPADGSVAVSSRSDLSEVPMSRLSDFVLGRPSHATGLRVEVDSLHHLDEADENNNGVSFDIQIPNFTVSDFNVFGAGVLFTVENTGGATVLGDSNTPGVNALLTWEDGSGRQIGNAFLWQVRRSLSAGERIMVDTNAAIDRSVHEPNYDGISLASFASHPPDNAAQLRVVLDSLQLHTESNEDDNAGVVARPLPDLAASNVAIGGQYADGVSWTLKNIGRGIVPAGRLVEYELRWTDANGNRLDTGVIYRHSVAIDAPLLPEAELWEDKDRAIFFAAMPEGAAAIDVIADPLNFIPELNEENNAIHFPLPAPDFIVSGAAVYDDTLYGVTETVARYTIVNDGAGRSTVRPLTIVHQWLDGDGLRLGSSLSFDLNEVFAPRASYHINTREYENPAIFDIDEYVKEKPAGAVTLSVLLDPANGEREESESNNGVSLRLVMPETTAEDMVEEDETVEPEDVGEEDVPDITPENPLYFLKRIGQGARLAVTFDDEKNATLRKRYANEKILEVQELLDKGKKEAALRHAKRYQKDMEKLKESIETLEQEHPDAAEDVAEDALKDQFAHQTVLGKIEKDEDPVVSAKAKEIRAEVIGAAGELARTIPEERMKHIADGAVGDGGSPLKALRNAEVLSFLRANAPESVRDALKDAEEQSVKRLNDQLAVVGAIRGDLISAYANRIGGDETVYLRVFDKAKQTADDAAIGAMIRAKEKMIDRVADRLELVKDDPRRVSAVLKQAENGDVAGMRVLKDIEDAVSPALADTIRPVNELAKKRLSDRITNLQTDDARNDFFQKEVRSFSDVRQVTILRDVLDTAPDNTRQAVLKLHDQVIERIADRVEKVKNNPEQIQRVVGDTPSDIATLESIRGRLGGEETKKKLSDAQEEILERKIDAIDTEARLQDLEAALKKKQEARVITDTVLPNISDRIREKREASVTSTDMRDAKRLEEERLRLEAELKKKQLDEDRRQADALKKRQDEELSRLEAELKQAGEKERQKKEQELQALKKKQEEDRARMERELAEKQAAERKRIDDEKRKEQKRVADEKKKQEAERKKLEDDKKQGLQRLEEEKKQREEQARKDAETAKKKELERSLTPSCKADEWTCTGWGVCQWSGPGDEQGKQTQTCTLSVDCPGVVTPKPAEIQTCIAQKQCSEDTWKCNEWAQCQWTGPGKEQGKQTRTCVLVSDCAGVLTPKPAESQECLATPSCTADQWNCTWSACTWAGPGDTQGEQSVTECYKAFECTAAETPAPQKTGDKRACTVQKPVQTITKPQCASADWNCASWSACSGEGKQIRNCSLPDTCTDSGISRPAEVQSCTPECTSSMWTCASWSACAPSEKDPAQGIQTRTCAKNVSCSGGISAPAQSQSCALPIVKYPATLTISIDGKGNVTVSPVDIQAGGKVYLNNAHTEAHTIKIGVSGTAITLKSGTVNMAVEGPKTSGAYGIYRDTDKTPITQITVH